MIDGLGFRNDSNRALLALGGIVDELIYLRESEIIETDTHDQLLTCCTILYRDIDKMQRIMNSFATKGVS